MFQFQSAPHAAVHTAAPAVWHSPPVPPPARGVVASLPTVRLGEASPPASARLLTATPPPTSSRSFNVRSVASGLQVGQPTWQHTHSEPANTAGFDARALRPATVQRLTGPVTVVISPMERSLPRSQPVTRAKDAEVPAPSDKITASQSSGCPQVHTPSAQDASPSSKVSAAPQSPCSSPQASTKAAPPASPSSPQLGRVEAVLVPPSPRQVKEPELQLRLSQVAAALLPTVAQAVAGAGAADALAPAPEEVPPWKPCQATTPVVLDMASSKQEIGWTPSFTTLAHLRPDDAADFAPTSPEVATEGSQDSPQEKPSRVSMAPTVHDAHCKDSDESEVISSPQSPEDAPAWAAADIDVPRQEMDKPCEPASPAEAAEALEAPEVLRLRTELEELHGALAREKTLRQEVEMAHSRTSKRLSSAEGRAAQLATDLQRCKVERDELRRQVHEKSEIHVELTRKLRKAQEANRSLDGELNKTEAQRLAAQNRVVAAREARGQLEALLDSLRDQVRDAAEADTAEAAARFLKIKEQLEGFAIDPQLPAPTTLKEPDAEEELPTAGGLLREWASVYDNTEDARRDLAPVLLQQRSPSWNKASKQREVLASSPPSARGIGEQLAQLSLRDLSEIKALKKPPPPIRMLMEVCCLLFNIQPVKHLDEQCVHHRLRTDYWEPARRYLLSDPFLLSKLRSHGKEVGPSQRAKIKKYFKDPEFSAERMLKCSRAAFELYSCVSRLMEVDEPPISSLSDMRSCACTTTTASSNETISSVK